MHAELLAFLDQNQIPYQRFSHPPVFTCEEARQVAPDLPGADTKNLFLRDGKGKRHFLVTVPDHKSVNLKALSAALENPHVVAFLVEPIQGEAGIIVPPEGYLREVSRLCRDANVLFIADEIQSGLGRTGHTLACDAEGVTPDVLLLGKALGGGIVPISAVASRSDVLGVLRPGEHGSTFGGNPLALAIAREVIAMLGTGEYQRRSAELGEHMLQRLTGEAPATVREVRGRGLWAGVEVHEQFAPVRPRCEAALDLGVIVKDTHATTMRLAPPLTISREDLDHGIDVVLKVLA